MIDNPVSANLPVIDFSKYDDKQLEQRKRSTPGRLVA